MVSRLPYKGGPLPRMYPMIMEESLAASPITNIKQEESLELKPFQNAYSKEICKSPAKTELPDVSEAPKLSANIKKDTMEDEIAPEKPSSLKSPIKEIILADVNKDSVALPKPLPKKESFSAEVHEPLDLSLPRKSKIGAVNPVVPGKRFYNVFSKELSEKYIRSHGERDLSSVDILQTRGIFRCGRPHFLVQKTSDFSKFMVCLHRQEG